MIKRPFQIRNVAVRWNRFLVVLLAGGLCGGAGATERRFTYTYEPETMPAGAMEFEQWITLGTQRTGGGTVQQQNYNQWQIREELEYGVTDRYTLGLYVNLAAEGYRDVSVNPAVDVSTFEFDGISLENRFLVLNPADHAVGLTLYLEPAFSGSTAEVEEKILLGQRHGDWKWAFNLIHATEWEDNLAKIEGEFAATFGIARDLGSHWSVGLEFWNQNALPKYQSWEYTAFFLGPVVSFRQEKWWATLTVLPQIYGKNYDGNPDGNTSLVLDEQERVNIRLLLGFGF
jgi:hypothetical protein